MTNNKQINTAKPNYLKDLLLLFAIPVGIAVFAAAAIYLPSLFANPKYDFVYSTCDDYNCGSSYVVDHSGYILQDYSNSSDYDYYDDRTASLRYYDAKKDSTRTLTFEEAKKYQLDASSKSPDGYKLTRESSGDEFLFWGNSNEGWYLKNGAKKKKVELSISSSYYSNDIKFLGWVSK